jgi:hypothetical protein
MFVFVGLFLALALARLEPKMRNGGPSTFQEHRLPTPEKKVEHGARVLARRVSGWRFARFFVVVVAVFSAQNRRRCGNAALPVA